MLIQGEGHMVYKCFNTACVVGTTHLYIDIYFSIYCETFNSHLKHQQSPLK